MSARVHKFPTTAGGTVQIIPPVTSDLFKGHSLVQGTDQLLHRLRSDCVVTARIVAHTGVTAKMYIKIDFTSVLFGMSKSYTQGIVC